MACWLGILRAGMFCYYFDHPRKPAPSRDRATSSACHIHLKGAPTWNRLGADPMLLSDSTVAGPPQKVILQ